MDSTRRATRRVALLQRIDKSKGRPDRPPYSEATVGLEPTVGVLQTPALPLGYVAGWIRPVSGALKERARGFGPPIFSLARRRSTTEPRPQDRLRGGAETQDRTGDTAIFSRVLYQLSYLGRTIESKSNHPRAGGILPAAKRNVKQKALGAVGQRRRRWNNRPDPAQHNRRVSPSREISVFTPISIRPHVDFRFDPQVLKCRPGS